MLAFADDTHILALFFEDSLDVKKSTHLYWMQVRSQSQVASADHPVLQHLEEQLHLYFAGDLMKFNTPYRFPISTSVFQNKAWGQLLKIPYGETASYQAQAKAIGHPKAARAIGQANRLNPLALIVPCHRVITKKGHLAGYAGSPGRKVWLLDHETRNALRIKNF